MGHRGYVCYWLVRQSRCCSAHMIPWFWKTTRWRVLAIVPSRRESEGGAVGGSVNGRLNAGGGGMVAGQCHVGSIQGSFICMTA